MAFAARATIDRHERNVVQYLFIFQLLIIFIDYTLIHLKNLLVLQIDPIPPEIALN
jgi:hypothetical protein